MGNNVTKNDTHGAPSGPGLGVRRESRIDRIARRAHELFEARDRVPGHAMDDWLQAEREIDAESSDEGGVKV